MRALIKVWDWHYQLQFNSSVKSEIEKYKHLLTNEELGVFNKIEDFYSNHVSFDLLIDQIEKHEFEENGLTDFIIKNEERMLPVPKLLEEYYEERMKTLKLSCEESSILRKCYESLCCGECTSDYDVYDIIFGSYLRDIKIMLKEDHLIHKKRALSVETDKIIKTTHTCMKTLYANPEVLKLYGDSNLDYTLNIKKGVGFAEYWPVALTNKDKDELIVYENTDAMNYDDFVHTMYHEIYPGHGHFFDYFKDIDNIDYGAMSLIEGWATYAEWHVSDQSYGKHLKTRGKKYLEISLNSTLTLNEKSDQIYKWNLENGYSHNQAQSSVVRFSQYIGFQESYYLGALCIEAMLKKGVISTPGDFLEYLDVRNKGEFFTLWV